MQAVLDFLNQPIVLSLITLGVGSFLLSLLSERRARNAELRDQRIAFLTQAGETFNRFIPHVYSKLRTGSTQVDEEIDTALRDLFASRMTIQVGSQAYLRSRAFPNRYYRLLDELGAVVVTMASLERGASPEETVREIQQRRDRIVAAWPLADEEHAASDGGPVDELILWMDTINHRAADLLASYLAQSLD